MARIQAKVLNGDRLRKKLQQIGRDANKPVRQAIATGALLVERDAKVSIDRGSKTGRVYEKTNPRRTHRASAPGEAPATDLGNLVRNITFVVDSDGLGASVESRGSYSRALEFGTTRMAARPFLFPAFEKNKKRIGKAVGQAVKKALRKAGR